FPTDYYLTTQIMLAVLGAGGFTTGGVNFDSKLRRQSLDPEDLIAAHVGGMDVCARGLLAAAAMIEDCGLEKMRAERYAGWETPEAQAMLESDLDSIAARVDRDGLEPQPRSGRQEKLENWVNRFV
ncbi:MAG TPA: xylose isomerase, partial [Methylomirabilota bacterium]